MTSPEAAAMREDARLASTSALEAFFEAWERRKGLAVVVFAACAGAATGATIALPDLYRATAVVLVEHDSVPDAFVRPSIGGEVETRIQSIGQQILSRERLADMIDRFSLYPDRRGVESRDALVVRMRRDVGLARTEARSGASGGTALSLALSFRSRDPGLAASVANALASSYVDANSTAREGQASRTAAFLESRLEELAQRLETHERAIDDFKRRHVGELPEQVPANLAVLERLNAELQQNREQQFRVVHERGAARRDARTADAPAEESPAERLERLRGELDRLLVRYSESHPDVVAARKEIESIEQIPASSPGPHAGSAVPTPAPDTPAAALGALQRDERRLLGEIREYQRRVDAAPEREQELLRLTREYDAAKAMHDTLAGRDEEARLADRLEARGLGERLVLLDPAVPPEAPEAPPRLALVVAGLVAAACAAAAAFFVAERLDTSFHSEQALRAFTRIPVLGSVPQIVTKGDRRRRRFRAALRFASACALVAFATAAATAYARGNDGLAVLLSRGGS